MGESSTTPRHDITLVVSAVVCTYKRPEYLRAMLPGVCSQCDDPAVFEVIVVDNNSADDTAEIVAGLQRTFSNLRYCVEPNQGVAHARNRGWQVARGTYVAYLDDECSVPAEWLKAGPRGHRVTPTDRVRRPIDGEF